ncbi:spermatogenesis-associated protein 13 [Phlyctochytrium bullatum]|nr:spermatogenesis-associated protein 13 [Phlyctochytrium bullatum]
MADESTPGDVKDVQDLLTPPTNDKPASTPTDTLEPTAAIPAKQTPTPEPQPTPAVATTPSLAPSLALGPDPPSGAQTASSPAIARPKSVVAVLPDADDVITSEVEPATSFRAEKAEEAKAEEGSGMFARALWDYDAIEDNEISFKAGEVITIIELCNEDWYEGRIGNVAGYFPANRVELLKERPPSAETSPEPPSLPPPEVPLDANEITPPEDTNAADETAATAPPASEPVPEPAPRSSLLDTSTMSELEAAVLAAGLNVKLGRPSATSSAVELAQAGDAEGDPFADDEAEEADGDAGDFDNDPVAELASGGAALVAAAAAAAAAAGDGMSVSEMSQGGNENDENDDLVKPLMNSEGKTVRRDKVGEEDEVAGQGEYSALQGDAVFDPNTNDGYLEPPWRWARDDEGQIYYWNEETGERTWDHPYENPSRAEEAYENDYKHGHGKEASNDSTNASFTHPYGNYGGVNSEAEDSPHINLAGMDLNVSLVDSIPNDLVRKEGPVRRKLKREDDGREPRITATWKTLYAIVCPGFIIFFKDAPSKARKTSNPVDIIPLSNIVLDLAGKDTTSKKNAFVITLDYGNGRQWIVAPDSEPMAWMDCIRLSSKDRLAPIEYENAVSRLFSKSRSEPDLLSIPVVSSKARRTTSAGKDKEAIQSASDQERSKSQQRRGPRFSEVISSKKDERCPTW